MEGFTFLRRERSLWKLASIPFGLSVLATVLALAGIVGFAAEIQTFVAGWLPAFQVSVWWEWLWVGPARLLVSLAGTLLFIAAAGGILIAAFLIASLLASPFLDALAQRVERLVAGCDEGVEEESWLAPLRNGGRVLLEEARRTGFFLSVQLMLLVAGVLVPGGQIIAPPAMTLFTILFLPLDFASYTLDRRLVSFRTRRRWVLASPGLMIGYGSAAFLFCLVPGLNLLAMPGLVVGGTLLALRHSPGPAS